MIDIEIDGKKLQAKEGEMIIQVADEAGIVIPRYCYHKKLSIAANCRMCLVQVEKVPKPLPACATQVTPGMKVFTQSPVALAAQRAVMEFLLINHPLDCPICDQGGQCELQDLAVGFGNDTSFYHDGKRAVEDKDIGPLISTCMTRCIHCTRCVRFGEEVAGLRELGATGRGEHMEIGTYIEKSLRSEVAGNIIDLCPVGALLSKPFLFRGRAWELDSHESIAAHDCLGSNIYIHTRRNQVMRVVPQENESINETWLSDRDRFSYLGITQATDRITQPMIRQQGKLQAVSWQQALTHAVKGLQQVCSQHGAEAIGALTAPTCTTEEAYLLQKVMRGIGSHNIDHRLRQTDFSDQAYDPFHPGINFDLAALEKFDRMLLVGYNIHREQPLAGLRVRKAALNGAKIAAVSLLEHQYNFPLAEHKVVASNELIPLLAGIAKVLVNAQGEVSAQEQALLKAIDINAQHQELAALLQSGEHRCIVLGALALHHPQAAIIRSLTQLIARLANANYGCFTDGPNTAGAHIAGALPHRMASGAKVEKPGLTWQQMLAKPMKALLLMNVEPEHDVANSPAAMAAVQQAEQVIALTPYLTGALAEHADVVLPITPFAENMGTYVNVEGRWQSFRAAVLPQGDSRPAWKVLRVLGNLFELNGFGFESAPEVLAELREHLQQSDSDKQGQWYCPQTLDQHSDNLERVTECSIYAVDNVVRRSRPLQDSLTTTSS